MTGILLVGIAEIAIQLSTAMGKYEASKKRESVFAIGFLTFFWSASFMFLWGTVGPGTFVFSAASLPTFTLRVLLDIALSFIVIRAVIEADPSTFAFLRTITIPLLLLVDYALGYAITPAQLMGILVIVSGSVLLFSKKGLSKRGKALSLASALLAVVTLSLYKYDITHFNSPEAEQFFSQSILTLVMVAGAYVYKKENVFKYLTHRRYLVQSVLAGAGSVVMSMAYVYAPASVITAAKRSFEILYSIAIGHVVFKEHHFVIKFGAAMLVISGVSISAFL